MMQFLDKKIKNREKIGTPTKKIKLNQDDQAQISCFQIPLESLIFIRNISKNQNTQSKANHKFLQEFQIKDFSINENPFFDQDKQNDYKQINLMTNQKEQKAQTNIPIKLAKKLTTVQKYKQNEYDHIMAELSLTKNNSTFPIANFMDQKHEEDGQNIYLTQLLSLKSNISLTDANNQNRQLLTKSRYQTFDQENRLQKDYEIKQNLGKYQANKESFICLNKLEKIFYYVKKINIKRQTHQKQTNLSNDIHIFLESLAQPKYDLKREDEVKQASDQIKLYNKDQNGYLLRFYQQWLQNNSLYMIYELGSYSLADKILSNQKLPQSEVWSVIYDAAETLRWIHSQNKIHMNIKPGNILKCRNKYKMSDPYITIQRLQQNLFKAKFNRQAFYFAPQIMEFKSYLQGIDFMKCQIYSLGISILQNMTGMPNSLKNEPLTQVKKYFKRQMHGYSSYLKRLLLRMVQKNHKRRPCLQQLLCTNIEQNLKESDKIRNQIKLKRSNSV